MSRNSRRGAGVLWSEGIGMASSMSMPSSLDGSRGGEVYPIEDERSQ
jgi:hypothetical protein